MKWLGLKRKRLNRLGKNICRMFYCFLSRPTVDVTLTLSSFFCLTVYYPKYLDAVCHCLRSENIGQNLLTLHIIEKQPFGLWQGWPSPNCTHRWPVHKYQLDPQPQHQSHPIRMFARQLVVSYLAHISM